MESNVRFVWRLCDTNTSFCNYYLLFRQQCIHIAPYLQSFDERPHCISCRYRVVLADNRCGLQFLYNFYVLPQVRNFDRAQQIDTIFL